MKVEDHKLIEASERELLILYYGMGIDDAMSFSNYKNSLKKSGTIVTDETDDCTE